MALNAVNTRLPYNRRMLPLPTRRLLTVWIALLAVLFGALAPSVSHALAAQRGGTARWAELCGVNGVKRVLVAAETPQAPQRDLLQHHVEHCPYCATHGGAVALPPPAAISFAVIGGRDVYPSLYYRAPAPLFPWSAARPRGPPAVS